MFELVQKMLYAAVGTVAVTEEKARELVKELENRGAVTTEEGKKLVKGLVEKGQQRSDELRDEIDKSVAKAISSVKLAREDDLQQLKSTVDELNEKLDALKNKCGQSHQQ